MVDFLNISHRFNRSGTVEVYPKFRIYPKSKDLMIRGGDFYAVWDEERGLWSTDESVALELIDKALRKYVDENQHLVGPHPSIKFMQDSESGSIEAFHRYCQKQCRDSFVSLDETLIFANTPVSKENYASKRLPYPLEAGSTAAYDKLIGTLYSEEDRHKIEWAIGAIVSGDSKTIQKFMVLYGGPGTGKSTILNIIQMLFEGYYSVFDARALGSSSASFALEAFRSNPLVAIQHDGDLSRIEDNTRLNSVVSHEDMTVEEKFKSSYTSRFKAFLFLGTNKPVKITDAKSGLIRRLIDVTPSGNKVSQAEYKRIMQQIPFELGAIARHCLDVYLEDPGAYDDYIPVEMMGASNDFFNFIIDSYSVFVREDTTTLKTAWEMYKNYCEDAKVPYPYSKRSFKEELKNYFYEFQDRVQSEEGGRLTNVYVGFKNDIFDTEFKRPEKKKEEPKIDLIQFEEIESIVDKERGDCPAQYANKYDTPSKDWDLTKTKLKDLDTHKLHYVRLPENHIVIDFDLKDESGKKSLEKNLEAASKWPPTYAELSKSGAGIHLHYIYSGDVNKLSRIYDENIEIKVCTGKQALRRKLTKCNNLPITTINSGLPLKGDDKVVDFSAITNEKALRTLIKRNLNKEYHASTKCSMDFIYKNLNDAYESGMKYDVTDLENDIIAFAANASNQSNYCMKLVNEMKFKSDDPSDFVYNDDAPIVFYDVEVFPNLFLVNWKQQGKGKPIVRMINPSPSAIEELCRFRLIGFNCRRYDNHMLYARMLGYDNLALYNLSQRIINSKKGENSAIMFGEAYNLSYTDIYDFAAKKQSLKKWEIELGIHHKELGLPWDQPVPEEKWIEVAEYCDNDVIATEAAFDHLQADFLARQILADLAGGSVNDTTNSLTTKIIFGNNRKPQSEFHYRNLAEPVHDLDEDSLDFLRERFPEMMAQKHGEAQSLLPYFPGYEYKFGKSIYRGEEVGEGGYVYAEPGMYGNVALLDVASMHPHSALAEVLFGPRFTRRFEEIVYGRVHIKHEAWDEVNKMLDGKLTPYIQKVLNGELTSKDLANALKIAINSVYGLTAAKFDNAFRDVRNIDNIVAKRGALFMVDLKHAVQDKGYKVVHIKTDSIKIADADDYIIQFVMDFGKRYGYTFEHEATYDRMCLVNDAVYIAKYKTGKEAGEWTATGKQFAVPYVYKSLFSKEPITMDDMRETFEVKSALYLDMNESLPDVSMYERELDRNEDKYKKGKLSDITFETECARLNDLIEKGHDYQFVGRVGSFCPVKPGYGGGLLMRENKGSYAAATGTKGYRWLESEMLLKDTGDKKTVLDPETGEKIFVSKAEGIPGNEDAIDRSYYDDLVNKAIEVISKHGNYEWFVSDDPYIPMNFMNIPEDANEEGLPWDELPFG